MTSEPKNKGGRPTKPDDQRLLQRSIRMLPAQWAMFDAVGGVRWLRMLIDMAGGSVDWLRGLIDKTRPKVPPDRG
jgi:hypothetical protein